MPRKKKEQDGLIDALNKACSEKFVFNLTYCINGEECVTPVEAKKMNFITKVDFVNAVVQACFIEDEYFAVNFATAFNVALIRFMTNIGDDAVTMEFANQYDVYGMMCENEALADYVRDLRVECNETIQWKKAKILNNGGVAGILAKVNKILEKIDNGVDALSANIDTIDDEKLNKLIQAFTEVSVNPEKVAEKFVKLRAQEIAQEEQAE